MTAGIYLHIPFCVKKCLYCDFISGTNSKETIENYINSMVNEIESTDIKQDVDSVFIGGGTPSSIPPEYIAKVVDCLRIKLGNRFLKDSEITIETNPKTISENALKIYHDAGINRISMGLQSCIDSELKSLGRIHTFKDFLDSYNIATRYFDNINIDLISGIPHQTMDSFKESLKKVGDLNPNHISVYSLIIEEGTPFYEMYGPKGKFKDSLPNEDIDREMYHFTKEYLSTLGYNRYEISNYAKENKESRHNLKYWKGNNYYGFGIAAASLVDNIRYKNTDNLKEYIDCRYNQALAQVEYLDSDSNETAEKRKISYLTLNWWMQTLLDRADRMSMASGLEARVPFCDYRLVQYMWNVPWEMKALHGREKGLLRYVVKDLLPIEIVERKKSPYPKTYNPTYLNAVKGILDKILKNPHAPIRNVLNENYIQEILHTNGIAFTRPWFGQLMTGPQLIAYICQVNMWLERYQPRIEI